MNPLDTPVREAVWAALDFESAGATRGATDEPVQVGMAVWRGGAEQPEQFFRSYVRSPVRITRAARAVHGIRDEDTRDAPPMPELWPEFKMRLAGAVVVAHGAGTERRFLRAFPLHGFGPWVDTLGMARAILPDLPEHSLATVVATLGLDAQIKDLCPGLDWHDALFDAVACLGILRHCVLESGLDAMTVGQLRNLDAAAYNRRRALMRTARAAGWDRPTEG